MTYERLLYMNVYYITLLLNEIDLLLCQFHEIGDLVSKFVILESNTTFSGKGKPYYLEQYKEMFKEWEDKIVYMKMDVRLYEGPWQMERASRRAILESLDIKGDDIVAYGDVDEISRRTSFQKALIDLIINKTPQTLNLSDYMYRLNVRVKNTGWLGTLMDYRRNINTLQEARDARNKFKINNEAGWHYSYLGDAKRIKHKIMCYSHEEINEKSDEALIDKSIKERKCFFDNRQLEIVNLDYPIYVTKNIQEFEGLIEETNPWSC